MSHSCGLSHCLAPLWQVPPDSETFGQQLPAGDKNRTDEGARPNAQLPQDAILVTFPVITKVMHPSIAEDPKNSLEMPWTPRGQEAPRERIISPLH